MCSVHSGQWQIEMITRRPQASVDTRLTLCEQDSQSMIRPMRARTLMRVGDTWSRNCVLQFSYRTEVQSHIFCRVKI